MDNIEKLPVHVAIIMDGNGRWAKQRMMPRLMGHNAGIKAMKEAIRTASNLGIKYLTVYAFSTENWKRDMEEVSGIFSLLVKFVASDLEELHQENVRVRVLGDMSIIPHDAKESMEGAIKLTEKNTGMQFNIAINYGSRAEILRAVNNIVSERFFDAVSKGYEVEEITEEDIARYLYTGEENGNIPDPDLIIRTSGEERLSNFLLWQAAYSEFAFTDTLWPDFGPEEFKEIIASFGNRDRRYGGRK